MSPEKVKHRTKTWSRRIEQKTTVLSKHRVPLENVGGYLNWFRQSREGFISKKMLKLKNKEYLANEVG